MARVLLGMGSNIEPEFNLVLAAAALRSQFSGVIFSSVYRSAAVGMDGGDDFLNACCLFDTKLSQQDIRSLLKSMEDAQQRDRSKGSWKPRTLDLDLLIYDTELVDDDLHRYAHAFVPAAELLAVDLPEDKEGLLTRVPLYL
jgi:2-amino-4-hydroxy-6-hydroxymethyldihydropteridine diphosphokinase